jgi:transposase
MKHFVGIDWADQKHDILVLTEDGRQISHSIIEDNWQGFQKLETLLLSLGDVCLNIERPNGLLVDWLVAHDWPVYFTPPQIVAHNRPRRSKSDVYDAFILANLLRSNNDECRLLTLQSAAVEDLKQVVRAYDHLQQEQRRLSNRLRAALKQYYPVVLDMFRHPDQLLTLSFLEQFPDPEAARAASLEQLIAFFVEKRYRYKERVLAHYEKLQRYAPPARVSAGHITYIQSLIPIMRPIRQQMTVLKRQIDTQFKQHPDAEWWLGFPGLHTLNGARLLVYIGDNRDRFPTADRLRAVAGTVPITRSSGKRVSVYFRKECSHPLRKAITDMARNSTKRSGWAKSYYDGQLARGHKKARAQRALANRWVGIIWKLWQTGEQYDEMVHVMNRSRQGLVALSA